MAQKHVNTNTVPRQRGGVRRLNIVLDVDVYRAVGDRKLDTGETLSAIINGALRSQFKLAANRAAA